MLKFLISSRQRKNALQVVRYITTAKHLKYVEIFIQLNQKRAKGKTNEEATN